mgnify:CR=1 FL=1
MIKYLTFIVIIIYSTISASEVRQPLHRVITLNKHGLVGPVKSIIETYNVTDKSPLLLEFNTSGYLILKKFTNRRLHEGTRGLAVKTNELYIFRDGVISEFSIGHGDIDQDKSLIQTHYSVISYSKDKKVTAINSLSSNQASMVSKQMNSNIHRYKYLGDSYKETIYGSNSKSISTEKIYEYIDGKLVTVLNVSQKDNSPQFTEFEKYTYVDGILTEIKKPFRKILLKYNDKKHLSDELIYKTRTNSLRERNTYSGYAYDQCGNWIERTETKNTSIASDASFMSLKQPINNSPSIPEEKFVTTKLTKYRDISYFKDCDQSVGEI